MEEVRITSGHFEADDEISEFEREWPGFVVQWNSKMEPDERERIYSSSWVRAHAADLISVLIAKGHATSSPALIDRWWNA